jgi:peptide/nickel transport system substrate-binding protein
MVAAACGPSSSRSGSSPGNVSPGLGLAAANPDQRAALVVKAEELTIQQLPWIPDVQPDTVLVLGKSLSGAVSSSAYLFFPWANPLGRTG